LSTHLKGSVSALGTVLREARRPECAQLGQLYLKEASV